MEDNMQPAVIEGWTHAPGAPKDWNPEKHGRCSALPIRAEQHGDLVWMRSAWQPTDRELVALNAGANVELSIQGTVHPVVSMGVGPLPAEVEGEVVRVSFVVTQEVDAQGAIWCRVVGQFGHNRFPAGMEIGNPAKPELQFVQFEEAAGRLINAVTLHARTEKWIA
jgi:hypothetical protein